MIAAATEGLQAVGEDDDLLMAMARELVTEKGIGESAEVVWKLLRKRNSLLCRGSEYAEGEKPRSEVDSTGPNWTKRSIEFVRVGPGQPTRHSR